MLSLIFNWTDSVVTNEFAHIRVVINPVNLAHKNGFLCHTVFEYMKIIQ